MASSPPPKLDSTTTELAKQRNRAAAERTLTAWIQSCLLLIVGGIALDRMLARVLKAFPNPLESNQIQLIAQILSLCLIALGSLLLGVAIWQYRLQVNSLQRQDYLLQSNSRLLLISSVAIALFGIMATIILILISSY
jgi:putative membrane protein